jgi:predicted Zn-dependent peptidase
MRFRILTFVWAAVLVLLYCGCPPRTKLPTQPHIGGFVNYNYAGIDVLHQYADRPYVHIRLHFRWPAVEESSHAAQNLAVEAAFFAGAGQYDPAEFAERMEAVPAQLSFLPTPDGPVIVLNCLKEDLDATWALLQICLSEPNFDKDAFIHLRQSRITLQKARAADREAQALQAALEAAWPGTEMGDPLAGTAEALGDVARATAQETFRDLMRQRCNLRLTVVGPIEAERISDLLLNTVERLPEGECVELPPLTAAPLLQQVAMRQESYGIGAVAAVFPAPQPQSPAAIPNRLLMEILDHRLRTRLVTQGRLALSAQAYYVARPPGFNVIRLTGANAFQTAEFALSELRKAKLTGFTPDEIETGKKTLSATLAIGYETAPGLAANLDAWSELKALYWAGNERSALTNCNAKSVNALFKQSLTGITWGLVGDTAHVDRSALLRL